MQAALAELPKPLTSVLFHLRPLTSTTATSTTAVDTSHLLRVSTILYQQQHSPDSRLHASLRSFPFHLTPEFFLRVCNNFPLSWRPVHRFYQFTLTRPDLPHSSLTLNKLADGIGKSQNVTLFWEVASEQEGD